MVTEPIKIYFETSAVLDYILATGRDDEAQRVETPSYVPRSALTYLKSLLREDKRYRLGTEVRRAIDGATGNCLCLITPIVRYECYEKLVEERFKNDASEALLAKFVRGYSRKQVGDYLGAIRKDAVSSPDAEALYEAIARDFTDENLFGLVTEPCSLELNRENYSTLSKYAFLQVGVADALHLLAAHKLGCQYFFTTDEDFHRTREDIKSDFGIEVLFKDAILSKLRA